MEDILYSPISTIVEITNENLRWDIIRSKKFGCLTKSLRRDLAIIVDRYARRSQWRGYRWIEEMKADALNSLIDRKTVLKFDENKFTNPHGYITCIIKQCFITRIEHMIKCSSESLSQSSSSEPGGDNVQRD